LRVVQIRILREDADKRACLESALVSPATTVVADQMDVIAGVDVKDVPNTVLQSGRDNGVCGVSVVGCIDVVLFDVLVGVGMVAIGRVPCSARDAIPSDLGVGFGVGILCAPPSVLPPVRRVTGGIVIVDRLDVVIRAMGERWSPVVLICDGARIDLLRTPATVIPCMVDLICGLAGDLDTIGIKNVGDLAGVNADLAKGSGLINGICLGIVRCLFPGTDSVGATVENGVGHVPSLFRIALANDMNIVVAVHRRVNPGDVAPTMDRGRGIRIGEQRGLVDLLIDIENIARHNDGVVDAPRGLNESAALAQVAGAYGQERIGRGIKRDLLCPIIMERVVTGLEAVLV
jgi:hypothetical protein